MIRLDFEIDERALVEDGQFTPATASQAALEETFFVTPFRFCIDGIELIGVRGRSTHPLPLLGFASHLHQAIKATRAGEAKRCYLAGGGDLLLERKDNTMRVSSSLTGKTVIVDADDLLEAARSLLTRARDVLLKRFPEMQAHPAWQGWFST